MFAALVAVGALTGDDDPGEEPPPVAEGCLAVERTTPVPKGGLHKAGTIPYADAPPNSGEHSPNTLRNAKRFYSRDDNPAPEQAVHDLEHGLVVAWYDDELPDDQVAQLQGISQGMGARYVAVPWRRSVFPGGRHFVLTAWGKTQRCDRVSPEAIRQFIEDHADSKDAPEAGYSV